MPCNTPFRGDSSQLLLYKIASCCFEGGGGGAAGVASFNGRTGVVTLTSGDVTGALGFTPISESDGDARYVLKAGDTMTGSLNIANSAILVASDPALDITQTWNNAAVTFAGLQSNITNTASNSESNLFLFQSDGIDRFRFAVGGQLYAIRQDATNSGQTFFLRKRGNAGGATNAVAADSTIGTIAYSGWDGTAYATGSRISGEASEAWTNIAHGSRIRFYTTPIGSTAEQITLQLSNSGQTQLLDGTAALPALTFQSDPDTGIYRIGANSFGLSAGGALSMAVSTAGVNVTAGLAYQYNAVNVIRAQTALENFFFASSGNLTMTGANNLAFGASALLNNTSGANNVAIGFQALRDNLTGSGNVGIGLNALVFSTSGTNDIAIGFQALFRNTTGGQNIAIGVESLKENTTGGSNIAIGVDALKSSTTSSDNIAIGFRALFDITTATVGDNTAIGHNTGRGITTGINNTILGANVTGLAAALSNNIILADGAGVIRLQINSSGNTTLAGTVQTAAGTAALPAFSFTGDPNTGLYNIGADSLGLSTGGTLRTTTNTTDLILATAFRLAMASGANQRAGNLTLIGGTLTVANTSVTANTIILLTRKTAGGTIGFAVTYTVIAATSFTVTSDNALDTSTYSYLLIEVP